jgi:hypothetical protein
MEGNGKKKGLPMGGGGRLIEIGGMSDNDPNLRDLRVVFNRRKSTAVKSAHQPAWKKDRESWANRARSKSSVVVHILLKRSKLMASFNYHQHSQEDGNTSGNELRVKLTKTCKMFANKNTKMLNYETIIKLKLQRIPQLFLLYCLFRRVHKIAKSNC